MWKMRNHSKMQNIWKIRNIFHDILFILENVQYSGKCKTNCITLIIFVWKIRNFLENAKQISDICLENAKQISNICLGNVKKIAQHL